MSRMLRALLVDTNGLAHDTQQLRIDRPTRVGLIVRLVALAAHGQYAGFVQPLERAHQVASVVWLAW